MEKIIKPAFFMGCSRGNSKARHNAKNKNWKT